MEMTRKGKVGALSVMVLLCGLGWSACDTSSGDGNAGDGLSSQALLVNDCAEGYTECRDSCMVEPTDAPPPRRLVACEDGEADIVENHQIPLGAGDPLAQLFRPDDRICRSVSH